jgi:hypothetical protein
MKINALLSVLSELILIINIINGKLTTEKEKYGK